MSCCLCTIALAAVVALFLYKLFCCRKCCKREPELQEKNYSKDVVYLYQFPRYRTVPNISPYCLKIESFLRLNKINYENRFTMRGRSKYGLLPFIELNGEHIADSQLIEEHLKKHFNIESSLSDYDQSVARAAERLVSHHFTLVCIKYKMIDEASDSLDQLWEVLGIPACLEIFKPLSAYLLKRMGMKRVKRSIGLFSDSEFDLLLRKDLDALKGLLGDKQFFMGDTISNTDASIFGHIASLYYVGGSKKGYVARVLDEEYKTIVDWLERVKQELFPTDFTKN